VEYWLKKIPDLLWIVFFSYKKDLAEDFPNITYNYSTPRKQLESRAGKSIDLEQISEEPLEYILSERKSAVDAMEQYRKLSENNLVA
jgi:hypothetical protein